MSKSLLTIYDALVTKIKQIISGGQTGVDRAALDAAIFVGLPHGGWCPLGRLSEDGSIPEQYLLKETHSPKYSVRTERNVFESDGTLILFRDQPSKGTELTKRIANSKRRPLHCVELTQFATWDSDEFASHLEETFQWITEHNIGVLNVAGPRESSFDGIGRQAEQFLVALFSMAVL